MHFSHKGLHHRRGLVQDVQNWIKPNKAESLINDDQLQTDEKSVEVPLKREHDGEDGSEKDGQHSGSDGATKDASHKDSDKASKEGSHKHSDENSKEGSHNGDDGKSKEGSHKTATEDSHKDHGKASEDSSHKDSDKTTKEGSHKDSDKTSEKGSHKDDQGTSKDAHHKSDEASKGDGHKEHAASQTAKHRSTIYHTVYRTQEPTLSGAVASYKTHGGDKDRATAGEKHQHTHTTEQSTVPTAIHNIGHGTKSVDTILAHETGLVSASQPSSALALVSVTGVTAAAIPPTGSATASPDNQSSGKTSPGAQAGIAFGVLGGVLIVGLVVYLLFARKKRQQRIDNEKMASGGPGVAAAGGLASTFTPIIAQSNMEAGAGKGAAMALTPTAASVARNNTYERPGTSQSYDPANPFGHQAERAPSPNQGRQFMDARSLPANSSVDQQNPFSSPADGPPGAAMTRKTSLRKENQPERVRSLTGTPGSLITSEYGRPDSPAGSMTSSSGNVPSNVHRVQLDFKPTLEDELELKAGDLVRLLHEYDDGWALCLRMNRSRQGVCPRACLSTRPVKPRPANGGGRQGPPVNHNGPPRGPPRGPPNGAPYSPNQRSMRPYSPAGRPPGGSGSRPQSPATRPMGASGSRPQSPAGMRPDPRSQSPAGMRPDPRSQSPGLNRLAASDGRSQSPSTAARRTDAPGPSPMNPRLVTTRKPVPGQAI